MQSNIDCIMDDLNDFPDSWVELYNPTDAAINLGDYKIGTKDKIDKAWQLPNKSVAAKGYVIIYCDKAGEDEGVSAMHTNFRLESGKDGKLYLFKGSRILPTAGRPTVPTTGAIRQYLHLARLTAALPTRKCWASPFSVRKVA